MNHHQLSNAHTRGERLKRQPTEVERPNEQEDQATAVPLRERPPQQRSDTVAGDKDGDEQNTDFFRDVEMLDDGRDQARRRGRGERCGVSSYRQSRSSERSTGLAVYNSESRLSKYGTPDPRCIDLLALRTRSPANAVCGRGKRASPEP